MKIRNAMDPAEDSWSVGGNWGGIKDGGSPLFCGNALILTFGAIGAPVSHCFKGLSAAPWIDGTCAKNCGYAFSFRFGAGLSLETDSHLLRRLGAAPWIDGT
jgi:hypothetical protein